MEAPIEAHQAVFDVVGEKKLMGRRGFTRSNAAEDYPNRVRRLWHCGESGDLCPQLWLRLSSIEMANALASLRPDAVDRHLVARPEVVVDDDGTAVVVFRLDDSSSILPFMRELRQLPIKKRFERGIEKPIGGVVVGLIHSEKDEFIKLVNGQPIDMGRVVSW